MKVIRTARRVEASTASGQNRPIGRPKRPSDGNRFPGRAKTADADGIGMRERLSRRAANADGQEEPCEGCEKLHRSQHSTVC